MASDTIEFKTTGSSEALLDSQGSALGSVERSAKVVSLSYTAKFSSKRQPAWQKAYHRLLLTSSRKECENQIGLKKADPA